MNGEKIEEDKKRMSEKKVEDFYVYESETRKNLRT